MSQKPKLHQLAGQIKSCWPGKVASKGPHKNQPFYCLEINLQNLFTEPQKATIYAFANLVPKEVWNTLAKQDFKEKKYHFFCEKRVRGWRLIRWEELSNQWQTIKI